MRVSTYCNQYNCGVGVEQGGGGSWFHVSFFFYNQTFNTFERTNRKQQNMSKTRIKETGASGRTFFSSEYFSQTKKILKLSDIEHCEFHSMNVLLDTFSFLRAFLSVSIPSM